MLTSLRHPAKPPQQSRRTPRPSDGSREELDDLIQCRHLQQIVDSRQSDIKHARFEDNEI